MRARSTAAQTNRDHSHPSSHVSPPTTRRDLSTMDPFVPARLMSSDNRSNTELVPLRPTSRNVSMARSSLAHTLNVRETLYDAAFPDIFGTLSAESRSVSMAISTRTSSQSVSCPSFGESYFSLGLVDGGANTGLANLQQMRLLYYAYPSRYINVDTAGGMRIQALQVGTFAAKATTKSGEAILLIFNEYGELRQGPSVHSKIQLADGGCQVCDAPIALSGKQCITIHERVLPLVLDQGLPFIKTTYPSDEDLESLPRVNMTCSTAWNPSKYDGNISDDNPTTNEPSNHPTNVSVENISDVDIISGSGPDSSHFNPFDEHSSLWTNVYRGQNANESFHLDINGSFHSGPQIRRFYYCDDLFEAFLHPSGMLVREVPEREARVTVWEGFQMRTVVLWYPIRQ